VGCSEGEGVPARFEGCVLLAPWQKELVAFVAYALAFPAAFLALIDTWVLFPLGGMPSSGFVLTETRGSPATMC
jgi:hypothetical protein